jgi:SAM-dependent methyltransferase
VEENSWETIYAQGGHNNAWPWSELVSSFYRHRELLTSKDLSVLDLGSGTGNNYPFWKSLGVDYYGIDISKSATDIFFSKFPEVMDGRVKCGDFSFMETIPVKFDVVSDRGSLTCGDQIQISKIIPMILNSLNKGGLYIGIDWYSKSNSDFNLTSTKVDRNSRRDISSGPLAGVGTIHFADESDMLTMFQDFEIIELSEKRVKKHFPAELKNELFATWNIIARKPL